MDLKGKALQRHAWHSLPRIATHAALLITQCSDLFFSNKNIMICCQLWFCGSGMCRTQREPTEFRQATKERSDDEKFGLLQIHFPH